MKVCILRKLGRYAEAEVLTEESLALDRFNFGILYEKSLLHPDKVNYLSEFKTLIRSNIHTYIEFALDYASSGLFEEAIDLIDLGIREQKNHSVYPMAFYYKAWFESQNGNREASLISLTEAASASSDYCFPNQTEAVVVLEWAKKQNSTDAKAPYYLGNFWYSTRQYVEAVANWELSASIDDSFPTVHRNLALACFNKQNDRAKALQELEKAFHLDQSDARILMELDQLYKRMDYTAEFRLEKLDKYPDLVDFRDYLYLERITLLNSLGDYRKALDLIMLRKFHPWEGGEGKVTGQYVFSLVELAKKSLEPSDFGCAIDFLNQAQAYPANLGEGKLYGYLENDIYYLLGCAFEGLGNPGKANENWQVASRGLKEPILAIFYNDQKPNSIFYQGLAFKKLGKTEAALERFQTLINYGKRHLNDQIKLDYFAVSLPDLQIWHDDLSKRNRQNCENLISLGELGLRELGRK